VKEMSSSKLASFVAAVKPFVGQSKKQKALVISLICANALMIPFVVHGLQVRPQAAPASTDPTIYFCCWPINPNTITIASGNSANILTNFQFSVPSGQTYGDVPISVSGNFTSSSHSSFTVNWIFNGTTVISSPSFATKTPSSQTIGVNFASFTAFDFFHTAQTGPLTYIVYVTVQNNGPGTLYDTNSYIDWAVSYQ
jgi:hypothetical protein